ncbi:helix-turn-helix domain-containing protein [Falsigemmobacter faecalis]|nr:helix-turn-helix domain-containing protein [Falsigemmobacter faecalis]
MPKTSEEFWPIFRDLVEAREHFNLARPVLTTLRALISFMDQGCIVFAGNRKICERAEGISQSSLRRHLTALISAGLARRVSSPNGKRYALRTEGLDDLIFGIDLTPMRELADQIADAAEMQRNKQARIRHLRKEMGALLYQCTLVGLSEDQLTSWRRDLRRKLSVNCFEILIAEIKAVLHTLNGSTETAGKTHVSDSQNDCQIDTTKERIKIVIKPGSETDFDLMAKARLFAPEALDLLQNAMNEDLNLTGQVLGKWIGVPASLIERASFSIGAPMTVMSLLLVIQNIDRIRNPAAYFSAMTLSNRREAFLRSMSGPKVGLKH